MQILHKCLRSGIVAATFYILNSVWSKKEVNYSFIYEICQNAILKWETFLFVIAV